MNLPLWSLALYLLLDSSHSQPKDHDKELQRLYHIFELRSDGDWLKAWHTETHNRCREDMQRHIDLACAKDIYKINKKNELNNKEILFLFPKLMPERAARSMLRVRRSAKGSITNECCISKGCTWEEYAEYCHDNKRLLLNSK